MSKNAAVNIKQVARHARVSTATVSRALQLPDLLAPPTLERVMQSVEALGYTPNVQARNLRTARTRVVVALVPNIANPFYTAVLQGIDKVAHANGYSMLLADTHYNVEREQSCVNMVGARQADGLITFLPRLPHPRGGSEAPAVNACSNVTDPQATSVDVDNVAAARDAVRYLIALGHRDIGFIAGTKISPNSQNRQEGYRQAKLEAGLPSNPKLLAVGDFSVESGIHSAGLLLDRHPGLTAIFCANDEMAMGAMKMIKSRGLRIPEDISVIGFDDIHFAQYFDPPLTTVAQPKDELGQEAMRLLLEILNDPTTPPRRRVLPASLVIRGSTGPASAVRGAGSAG